MENFITSLQDLPGPAKTLILQAITVAVLWALLAIFKYTGFDLRGYANAIAAVLAPLVIELIAGWLQLIPPIFDNLVTSIIDLIVLLIGSLGLFWVLQRKGHRAPSLTE